MSEPFQITHIPIMKEKILEYFLQNPIKDKIILDGTAGEGGHSEFFLRNLEYSKLILVDRDPIMMERALTRLEKFADRIKPIVKNFSEITKEDIQFDFTTKIDCVLLDFGISTYHIKHSKRGFSFQSDEPLDMTLDDSSKSAYTILNHYTGEKLLKIFKEYGEEKWTNKIVPNILQERKKKPIKTTKELALIIEKTIPRKFWPEKVHPSFRIFQALRIESNQELNHIQSGILKIFSLLEPNGIFTCLSFHSLEDRIVKNLFKDFSLSKQGIILTKKPVLPDDAEIQENSASRSAKLRAFQKFGVQDGT
jgi:16S rRNA (cytosine1402-N4)-methyltransferase